MTAQDARKLLADSEVLFTVEEVNAATSRIAKEINRDFADVHPLILSVMGGAVVFTGQLLPQLDFPLDFDIVQASRYGDKTVGAQLTWRVAPRDNIVGRHVIILDDILDEGITLAAIVDLVKRTGAKSVACAVFCVKDYGEEINNKKPLKAEYVGISVPNRFIYGYGMDVSGAWRNLPAIYAVKGK
ncbi:MAG: hypoxanthine-guanine phosphoribosyltransferase [Burkholderiales bacterium]|nr:hypoxanthine-guanine phosphoribosyltransferase [Burkholderiales bacterium]